MFLNKGITCEIVIQKQKPPKSSQVLADMHIIRLCQLWRIILGILQKSASLLMTENKA